MVEVHAVWTQVKWYKYIIEMKICSSYIICINSSEVLKQVLSNEVHFSPLSQPYFPFKLPLATPFLFSALLFFLPSCLFLPIPLIIIL